MKRPWEVDRRACLRGAGAAIGLPMLEVMLAGEKRARAAAGPCRRLVWFLFQGGTPDTQHIPPAAFSGALGGPMQGARGSFWPTIPGDLTAPDYRLTPILEPLDDLRKDVLLIQNLHNTVGTVYYADEVYPGQPEHNYAVGDHERGPNALLCAMSPTYVVTPNGTAGTTAAKSCDQAAADALRTFTPSLPSLCLGNPLDPNGSNENTLSWRDATTRNQPIERPSQAFLKVFGDGGADPKISAKRLFYKKSILDFVKADRDRLSRRLGRADQLALDKYLTAIRDLESAITAPDASAQGCGAPPAAPEDVPGSNTAVQRIAKAWLDLVPLAFQCDRTRVVVIQLDLRLSYFKWLGEPNLSYPLYHDDLQHGGSAINGGGTQEEVAERGQAYLNAVRWIVEQFGTLVRSLKSTQEGDLSGPMLNNSLLVCTSELSYGNGHDMTHLPVIVAGRGGGAAAPGRHIAVREQPIANLWLSMLNAAGVSTTAFESVVRGPTGALRSDGNGPLLLVA